MIKSFKDSAAKALFEGTYSGKKFSAAAQKAKRRLDVLHAAASLLDLAALNSNCLEALAGDRKGQHSIRVDLSIASASTGTMATRKMWKWWTTINAAANNQGRTALPGEIVVNMVDKMIDTKKKIQPTHPGEILQEEMHARGITINFVARALRVPPSRIDEIVKRRRAVTAETALRLARFFGTSAQFWLNLQTAYDLAVASSKLSAAIEREVLPHTAA